MASLFGCSSNDNAEKDDTPDPTPIGPPQQVETVQVLLEDFESGWGHFLGGGEHASLSKEKAFAGTQAVKLDGNFDADSSIVMQNPINLLQAESVDIQFWIYGENLATGDALDVDFSDGTRWVNVLHSVQGSEFGNAQFTEITVRLSREDHAFSRTSRLRVTSSTIANAIYIDNFSVTAKIPVPLEKESSFDHYGVVETCVGCHNNRIAEGKSATHRETSDACEQCHVPNKPEAWFGFTRITSSIDHSNIVDSCLTCHNNEAQVGKGPLHIDSSNECQQCHAHPLAWRLPTPFAHENLIAACVDCHNGVDYRGKNANHRTSSDSCENCHAPDQNWSIITAFDHTGTTEGCFSCHNGVRAVGKKAFHIPSSNVCEDCHSPDNGWWLNGVDVFDHKAISTGCVACHNGTFASGKSSNHIVSGDACESCHVVGGKWNQVNIFSHENITNGCVNCHNGVEAQGKGEFHIGTGENGDNCERCHQPNRGWLVEPAPAFAHGGIVSDCVSCHNNEVYVGKGPTHISSPDRCETCHKQAGVTWSVDAFNHDGITSECASCHNSVDATGKSDDHLEPSPDVCETCHQPNNAWQFEYQAPFSHTGINRSCFTCHNGTLVPGKNAGHIESSNECQTCHNAGGNWSDAKFTHEGITEGCVSCHDGTNPQIPGKPPTHIGSSALCETCHLPADNWNVVVVENFDHLNVTANCATCHNDGLIAQGKSPEHTPTDAPCETCHTPGEDWEDAFFAHSDIDIANGCNGCHADDKFASHFVTSLDCSECHQPGRWAEVNFSHPSSSAYPGDHAAGLSCNDCHSDGQNIPNQTVPWPSIAYTGSCAGCHENDYEPNRHLNESVSILRDCAGACHLPRNHSVGDSSF